MDGLGEWRLIEPEKRERPSGQSEPNVSGSTRIWLATAATLVLLSVGLAIWATLPAGGVALEARGGLAAPVEGAATQVPAPSEAVASGAAATLVVDVQGAVADPGLHTLAEGSRVGDAIAAAGGYSPRVDVRAAAEQLNLAVRLADGDKIVVPVLGEEPPAAAAGSPGSGPSGGLINLNTATAGELEELPGIGPVTAAKIIDARSEAAFASVDELTSRGIVGAATFEKIRDLVTTGR